MSGPGVRSWIAAAAALLVCTGCGFKGPLYLPEPTGTVITHPPQGAPTSGQAQTPGAAQKDKKDKNPPAPPPGPVPPPPR